MCDAFGDPCCELKWFSVNYKVRIVPDGCVYGGCYCGVSDLVKIPPGCQSCGYGGGLEAQMTSDGAADEW